MAVIDHTTRPVTAAFPALLVARVIGTANVLRRALANRRMFHHMKEMTDRELADVGLMRGDLHEAWRRRAEVDPSLNLSQMARLRAFEEITRRVA